MYVFVYVHECWYLRRPDKVPAAVKVVVRHRMWVLGAEPWFYARAESVLNHGVITPAFEQLSLLWKRGTT